jgi:replicative DNA helicase
MGNLQWPSNEHAERALIVSCMVDSKQREIIVDKCRPDYFFNQLYQNIFTAIRTLMDAGAPVDPASVFSELKREGVKVKAAEVSGLLDGVPVYGDIKHHVELIRQPWQKRILIEATSQARAEAQSEQTTVDDILRRLNERTLKAEENGDARSVVSFSDLVEKAGDDVERIQKGVEVPGVRTGFIDLDRVLVALQRSGVYIVAARPGVGKTAFAGALAYNASAAGVPVGFFSLEMSRDQLALRLLCAKADLEVTQAMAGAFSREDWKRFTDAQAECHNLPIIIDDQPGLHYSDIMRRARRLKRAHNVGIILVDYIQLAKGDRENGRVNEVASISAALKNVAKDIDVPVVALSQLNRKCEDRDPPRPKLSDIRDSGAIEQDADVVMALYREGLYSQSAAQNKADVRILKNRHGKTGTVTLGWHGRTMRFFTLGKHDPE